MLTKLEFVEFIPPTMLRKPGVIYVTSLEKSLSTPSELYAVTAK
jgi:hypothetical protein